jgi:hypothetical protein
MTALAGRLAAALAEILRVLPINPRNAAKNAISAWADYLAADDPELAIGFLTNCIARVKHQRKDSST